MENSNEGIKKAKKVLEEISQDEREQYLADLREKYILDMKDSEELGYDKGVKAGEKKKQIEVAKQMKKDNAKLEIIMKYTGLTEEEIEKL